MKRHREGKKPSLIVWIALGVLEEAQEGQERLKVEGSPTCSAAYRW
jgi:hypothetical protein